MTPFEQVQPKEKINDFIKKFNNSIYLQRLKDVKIRFTKNDFSPFFFSLFCTPTYSPLLVP